MLLSRGSIRRSRARRALRWLGGIMLAIALAVAALAFAAGFFDRDPIHFFGDFGPGRTRVAALYFSGDMGLRFGMGPHVTQALAARHIPVMGVSSPAIFARRRTRAEVDAVVAGAVRDALAHAHADRLVLIGQSFGSDIIGTGVADLPADLRGRIAAIVLVVPGQTVFFRADPTSLTYRGTPDGQAIDSMRTVSWAPVVCIYGQRETDSLCPLLAGPRVQRVPLPGGHFLANDSARLIATILASLRHVLPGEISA
uniref:AcvB/VirJ family lysyl-phosphatidylglycerol hydrolase n=1 Tax=Sphingomonas bacterium TaxID=1895847 RepID=UPI0026036621|nr:AcvB/VirJ family lysyl-phosphatidylglycerol hydrolase [Sphingomonas bacterium]